jgi:hypothetical protein
MTFTIHMFLNPAGLKVTVSLELRQTARADSMSVDLTVLRLSFLDDGGANSLRDIIFAPSLIVLRRLLIFSLTRSRIMRMHCQESI